jgi:predicted SprT family Zn-dependent metalloprotease
LTQPKRGRREAGLVGVWAVRFSAAKLIAKAVGEDWNRYERVMRCPVHKGYLGATAGIHYPPTQRLPQGLIELHQALFEPGREEDLRDTFLHEVGHCIDVVMRGRSGHSSSWRLVMADLDKPEESTYHNLEYLYQQRYTLHCSNCHAQTSSRDPIKATGRKCRCCQKGRLSPEPVV